MNRIGFAKDIHKLVEGRKLMLGGLHIPFNKGEAAHSDGDVVLHAISEAMLGAAALGDLGKFYPTNDKKYKNIASKKILLDAYSRIKKLKYKIVNIDVSIELEKPKLSPYINKIRKNIASLLSLELDQVSVKANTNEGFGEVGSNKAVVAYCIIMLNK